MKSGSNARFDLKFYVSADKDLSAYSSNKSFITFPFPKGILNPKR
jgi:hypothetical protein